MPADSPRPLGAERNLLFGILALQMDFISRDALIAAMNTWVLEKTKPLGQILTEQGALRAEDRDLMEVLIQRHLQMHGDNPQQSLAALAPPGSLHAALRQVADPEVHASLASLPTSTPPPDDPYATRPLAAGQPSVPGLRFRILREHAKGGLGAVFLANDEELHREVALKEIQEKYVHHPENRARFLLEAEVTGALEHPGVVPVYGLGRYPDGRPFYAMRFIRGNSFHEAIGRFYAADGPKRDPGERWLAFRELLGSFVAACNAIAYAHSRGILHRDIKPRNIMLGKYGETLVVDWGLAKVIGDREGRSQSEEGIVRPFSGSSTSPTQMGHVMGTPAYMSPEQAGGRLDALGPASDVYSLGATLYQLLTGREPIQGSHVGEILAKVKRGDWLPPRKVRTSLPAALDAICRKALALQPEARYASATALATDIEHWLADEPVAAYREPWWGRLRRWVRRHRGLAAGTAGLLITAVAALAMGIVLINQEKNRTEKERLRAQQTLQEMSPRAIDGWLSRLIGKLEPAQEEFLKRALTNYLDFAQESGQSEEVRRGVAEAHRRVGEIRLILGQNRAAEEAVRGAVDHYKQIVADFPQTADHREGLAQSYRRLGDLLKRMAQVQEAEKAFRDGLTIQKQLADEFPAVPRYRQQLANSLVSLGDLHQDTGRPKEAEAAYDQALRLRQQLAAQFPDDPGYREELAQSYNNLGILLKNTGRPKEAEAAYRDSLTLYQQLTDQFPANVRYLHALAKTHNNRGVLLHETGRFSEAEQSLHDAFGSYLRLLAELPGVPAYRQEYATSRDNLGNLLKDTGRLKEAEGPYREALAIRKQLAAEYPTTWPAFRQDLARSYNNLGTLLHVTGRSQEAEPAYREALTIQKQLAADFSNVPDYESDLANTMVNLAELCRDRTDYPQARELLEAARPHTLAALKANPRNPAYRLYFENNLGLLASTLAGLGDHAGAQQTAEQLAGLGWDPAGDAYAAARALAQCVRVLDHDTKLAQAKREELVGAYTQQALTMLRQAINKGYRDASRLHEDTDLEPLRSHPEFAQLLKKLEGK